MSCFTIIRFPLLDRMMLMLRYVPRQNLSLAALCFKDNRTLHNSLNDKIHPISRIFDYIFLADVHGDRGRSFLPYPFRKDVILGVMKNLKR